MSGINKDEVISVQQHGDDVLGEMMKSQIRE